jgi:phosphopantothenoylcysteine decarboxylase / phosphopantothenate---cysteine ligase
MASLTVRQLDDKVKKLLRLRAARHGRSMEDEIRTILGEAAQAAGREVLEAYDPPIRPGMSASAVQPSGAIASGARMPAPSPAERRVANARRVLLIIGGGIAAYKSLDLIRRLQDRGLIVRCILTEAAQEFITPLAAGALAGGQVFTDLFDAKSEFDVGHIRLARDTDLVVAAPATADLMAKMANGHANDLASAVLLATDKPVLIAPAMNPMMWSHRATQRNLARLIEDGVAVVGPNAGEMAERGEAGTGRMAEPTEIADAAVTLFDSAVSKRPLAGRRIVITSGPTHEPIDPVRYIANRSSGKQGHAIAAAAAAAGAEVVLVSGPVNVPDPADVTVVKVESARQMLEAVEQALPADCAIFAAAVADWRVADTRQEKIKKTKDGMPALTLVENPDILATIAHRESGRPRLVIGFAAETEDLIANAKDKLRRKGCDWIIANDVSLESGVMGGDVNTVHLVSRDGVESWPPQSKDDVARALVDRIAGTIAGESG